MSINIFGVRLDDRRPKHGVESTASCLFSDIDRVIEMNLTLLADGQTGIPPLPFSKRAIDLCISSGLIILTLPLMALAAAFVFWNDPGPVFFIQERIGYRGRIFSFVKLRTMTRERSISGELLPESARIKPWGAFLRRTSLDELPQLGLVILGKMSLVGPRPLLVRYAPFFAYEERQRFRVLPGITGLAQVNGRNTTSWGRRFAYDMEYVANWSVALDMRILFKTVLNVVLSKGIVMDVNKVMEDLDIERGKAARFGR